MDDETPQPSTQPSRLSLSPPVRRLLLAAGLFAVLWIVFQVALPEMQPKPVMETPLLAAPVAEPVKEPAPTPAPETPAPQETEENPKPVMLTPQPSGEAEEEKPVEDTTERIKALEQKLQVLEQKPAGASDAAVRALEMQLTSQSEAIKELKEAQEKSLHTITRLDAFDRLQTKVRGGKPFVTELAQMQALAGGGEMEKALEGLADYQEFGIPRLEYLQAGFDMAARKALRPVVDENSGVWQRLKSNLSQLVVIRRVGEVEGDSLEAQLARAEVMLDKGDVEAALSELPEAKENEADALKAWRAHAKAYTAREPLLAELRTAILGAR